MCSSDLAVALKLIAVVIAVIEVPWKFRGNSLGLIEVKMAAPQLPQLKNLEFVYFLIEVRLPQLLVIN